MCHSYSQVVLKNMTLKKGDGDKGRQGTLLPQICLWWMETAWGQGDQVVLPCLPDCVGERPGLGCWNWAKMGNVDKGTEAREAPPGAPWKQESTVSEAPRTVPNAAKMRVRTHS